MPTMQFQPNFSIVAADGVIFMIGFLGGIWATWWALGSLKWEKWTDRPFSGQAHALRFILALIGGCFIGGVILLYAVAGQMLRFMG